MECDIHLAECDVEHRFVLERQEHALALGNRKIGRQRMRSFVKSRQRPRLLS